MKQSRKQNLMILSRKKSQQQSSLSSINEKENIVNGGSRFLSNKKILIIVENLPVPFDRRVWQEAKALKDAGACVSVISPKSDGFSASFEVIDGINIYRHKLPKETSGLSNYMKEYSFALVAEMYLAWKVYFKHGFDVIQACNPPDLIFLVALPFKLLGKKFVFDHHDINPELYETKFNKRGFYWRLLVLVERLSFHFADCSIATNESYRQIAINRGKMSEDRVFIVRSGPDLLRFTKAESDNDLLNGRKYLVGYVGVIGAQEGVDLLLEAVRYIVFVLKRSDVQFCLVGSGPSLAELKLQSAALGLADYVTFLGRVPDAKLLQVLSTADVCVNPDRVTPMNDKSTMNKILEYMALSKPIVQFEVTEGRVSAGEASLYAIANDPIDFAEKILLLLSDQNLRIEMGKTGRDRIEQDLSWEHQIPRLLMAYRKVLGLGAQ